MVEAFREPLKINEEGWEGSAPEHGEAKEGHQERADQDQSQEGRQPDVCACKGEGEVTFLFIVLFTFYDR